MIKLNAAKLSIAAIGAAFLSVGAGEAAQALTINTTPSWDGFTGISAFGQPNTATYGQTFTVGSDNVLQNFSFRLGGYFSQGNVNFAAYIMQWDGTKALGDILYQSAAQSTAFTRAYEEFVFNTGGIELTAGQQYVAFLSASNFFNEVGGLVGMGYLWQDVYAGGGFVFLNNGSDFSQLTSTPWQTSIGGGVDDTVFTASFTPGATPVPTPALVPGAIALTASLLRKRKAEADSQKAEASV